MKTTLTAVFFSLILAGFYGCKGGADKKIETALDSTKNVLSFWERHVRDSMYTDEAHKRFTDQINQLVQYNKTQGVVKQNLSDEQVKEVEKLYSKANSIKGKMNVSEMQLGFTRRGSNWAGEKIEIGSLNLDF